MEKHIVYSWEDGDTYVIVDTKADAEEFILSLAEESFEDDWFYGSWTSFEEFKNAWFESMTSYNKGCEGWSWRKPFTFLYAHALNWYGDRYRIQSCMYVEG